MARHFKSNVLKIFISLSFLLLFFQNCGQPGQLEISSKPLAKLDSSQNGDGYLGKPPVGEYVRSHLNYSCLTSRQMNNTQGRLVVNDTSATIAEDNCQDFSFLIPFTDTRFDYSPFNPDFITVNSAIYEKASSFNAEPDKAVEAFCRQVDTTSGLDVIAKINDRNEASIKIYTGQQNNGVWSSRVVPSFMASRNTTSDQLNYKTESFDLTVDVSNPQLMTFSGRVVVNIDGQIHNKVMTCRRTRDDSAINYSPVGLVGLWQMNGNTLDISGYSNHGTLVDPNNRITFLSGFYQESIKFDGFTNRVDVPPSASLNNLPQITIATWVWPTDDGRGFTNGGLVHKSDKAAGINIGWQFHIGAMTRSLGFEADFSDKNLYLNAGGLTTNTWNHVVVTWDGSPLMSGVKFYINGNLVTIGAGGNGIGTRLDDSGVPISFGHFSDYNGATLNGRMDQTAIWNRILTAAEVQNLYRTGSPVP